MTPEPVKWLNKEEAASILDLSPRRVLELATEGKLQSARIRNPATGQTSVQIDAGSVERMKWEREHPTPQPPQASHASTEIAKRVIPQAPQSLGDLAQVLRAAMENRIPSPTIAELWQRLYVTPQEAVRMTGMGLSVLAKRLEGERVGTRGARVYRVKELEGL